jgi:hypothetical protein
MEITDEPLRLLMDYPLLDAASTAQTLHLSQLEDIADLRRLAGGAIAAPPLVTQVTHHLQPGMNTAPLPQPQENPPVQEVARANEAAPAEAGPLDLTRITSPVYRTKYLESNFSDVPNAEFTERGEKSIEYDFRLLFGKAVNKIQDHIRSFISTQVFFIDFSVDEYAYSIDIDELKKSKGGDRARLYKFIGELRQVDGRGKRLLGS